MSRQVLAPTVLVTALLAGGCGQPPVPEVTFSADGRSVVTGPIRYCDIELIECEANDSAVAVLDVPAGRPVQISVPSSVADTPWHVVFRYRKDGEPVGGRSEVFTPGTRSDYTLQIPESGVLETLEVHQYGAPELADGEFGFRIRAAWVLAVGAAVQPQGAGLGPRPGFSGQGSNSRATARTSSATRLVLRRSG